MSKMIFGFLLTMVPGFARAADESVLLDVHINGYDIGKIGDFTLRDGTLLSKPAELTDLGFRVPSAAAGVDGLLALSDLAGVKWRLDSATQTVYFTASNDNLLPAQLRAGGSTSPSAKVESGTGATLNYDISGTTVGNEHVGTGSLVLRGYTPWGVASTQSLVYAGGGPRGPGSTSQVRLDSSYTFSDPDTLRQYRAGDFINGGLAWTRPVRFGGVQVSSNFSLRPDLVKFPLPSVSGSVVVPSTVDVLVNGNRLLSRQIQDGPFQIPQLPVVTGAGTVTMTVTNALGQATSVSLPFYASASLLAPGLQTYSVQMGAIRRNYSVLSNDYGDLAASGTYRRGIFPWLTVEGSAEATAGTAMAGAGVVMNVADLAVLNLSAAGSTGSGRAGAGIFGITRTNAAAIGNRSSGTQVSAGLQRIGQAFSLGGSVTVASHNYRDIAAMNGDPVPRLQLNASAGLSLGRFGSVGIGYTRIDSDTAASPVAVYIPPGTALGGNTASVGGISMLQPAQKAHVLTLSYSVQIANMSFYATGFRDSAPGGTSGVLAGVTIPLGPRSSTSGSFGAGASGPSGQVQAQQSAVEIGDWGYQAVASAGGHAVHEFAQLQYMAPWALVTAGGDRLGTQTTGRVEAQGALSYIDGGLLPSNTIPDAFAVVDTNGLANVGVMQENRLVGRTDSTGRLLVPGLRSFEANHLSINPDDVPQDATADVATLTVRPQDRSGVVAKFPIRVSHGALLRLVDGAGVPIPVSSTIRLLPEGAAVPVGYDGEAYLEDLGPHNRVLVEQPKGPRCEVSFDYRPVAGEIPAIGPLRCVEGQP